KVEGVSDFSKLAPIYTDINQIDASLYTEESLESSGFNELKTEIHTVYQNPNASQEAIDNVVESYENNIEDILAKLEEASTDNGDGDEDGDGNDGDGNGDDDGNGNDDGDDNGNDDG